MEEINWEEFKEKLDYTYRQHFKLNNLIAIKRLDKIYDLWQKGYRSAMLLLLLKEVELNEF